MQEHTDSKGRIKLMWMKVGSCTIPQFMFFKGISYPTKTQSTQRKNWPNILVFFVSLWEKTKNEASSPHA